MAWLLKVDTPQLVEQGTVLGGLLYTPQTSIDEVVALVKKSSSEIVVDLPNHSLDDIVAVLNAGASAVIAHSQSEFESLCAAQIPPSRLLLASNRSESEALIAQGQAAGVLTADDVQGLQKHAETCLVHTHRLVPVFQVANSLDELISGFTAGLTTDREDKLFTTVVVTPRHRVLGICYSSPESLATAIKTRTGVYQSRKRGLWHKGASSGAVQQLLKVSVDCDGDAVEFVVEQTGAGFCHNNTLSCFAPGSASGLDRLVETVASRVRDAVPNSYTQRLLSEKGLLAAKIREEADELVEAQTKEEVAWEAADLLYFMSVKLAQTGVSLADVERNLDLKSLKVTRRKGDAKPQYVAKPAPEAEFDRAGGASGAGGSENSGSGPITITTVDYQDKSAVQQALRRPAQSSNAFELSKPIVEAVRARGDAALLEFTAKFEKAQLSSPVLRAPFPAELMELEPALKTSIDLACDNVRKFHQAQLTPPLCIETSPGVQCSRFSRPIARVGLYVPGGSAILPSTAIHLGVPAQVAGCSEIVLATPPRADGTPSPEVTYVAHKIGASQIVLAGGAQAVAAMAYGTESVTKVDKILGPGNQFVTAAKMLCATDVNAQVSIDMPAGPSEVLVVADKHADKSFVVSDLLSQAEHGADSQVVLISIDWNSKDVEELQAELHKQATALPRCEVVRQSIGHSAAINVPDVKTAMALSNEYAPEHLILQLENASQYVPLVNNAGSVFVGALSPESCGDYTSGTNHTLPTYGYANQYSGVNTDTYLKYITSQEVSVQGLRSIGKATVVLAEREGLQGHANAVKVRLDKIETIN